MLLLDKMEWSVSRLRIECWKRGINLEDLHSKTSLLEALGKPGTLSSPHKQVAKVFNFQPLKSYVSDDKFNPNLYYNNLNKSNDIELLTRLKGGTIPDHTSHFNPLMMIAGQYLTGTFKFSLLNTLNYIQPKNTVKYHDVERDDAFNSICTLLGLVDEKLMNGHCFEIIFWLTHGDVKIDDIVVNRFKEGALMGHDKIRTTLEKFNYNGPNDYPAMLFAYATERIVPGMDPHTHKSYGELIMNYTIHQVWMATSLAGGFYANQPEDILIGPYRYLSILLNDKIESDKLRPILSLNREKVDDFSKEKGLEIYQEYVGMDVDGFSVDGLLLTYEAYINAEKDGVFLKKKRPTLDEKVTRKDLKRYTTTEIADEYGIDIASLISNDFLWIRKAVIESVFNLPKKRWWYGLLEDEDHGVFNLEEDGQVILSVKELELEDESKVKNIEGFSMISMDDLVLLHQYLDLTGSTYGNTRDGYERKVGEFAERYQSYKKSQFTYVDSFGKLSSENQVFVLNWLMSEMDKSSMQDKYIKEHNNFKEGYDWILSRDPIYGTNILDLYYFAKQGWKSEIEVLGRGYLTILGIQNIDENFKEWKHVQTLH